MINPLSKEGEELIFYNYKEPMKKVVGGYGYYGAILSTKEGDKIQCHICGNLFTHLGMHVYNLHGMSARDYKEKYNLAYKTALISEKMRNELKIRTIAWLNGMTKQERVAFRENRLRILEESKTLKRGQPLLTLETKNKRGTCPDQLLEKIKVVAKSVGRSPTKNEFIDYYKSQKYLHIIYRTFGSWDKAKEMAGYNKIAPGSPLGNKKDRYSNEELIEYLQIFYQENGKPPTETDCRRGLIPESGIYRKRFGSLPLAREAAGITEEVGRWIKR